MFLVVNKCDKLKVLFITNVHKLPCETIYLCKVTLYSHGGMKVDIHFDIITPDN